MINLQEFLGLKENLENKDCQVCQHYLYNETLGKTDERPWCAIAARIANRACHD